MSAIARYGTLPLILFLLANSSAAQESAPRAAINGKWDISVWAAVATGEENTNSFNEARIWTAGFFLGKLMHREVLGGWRRGTIEYGSNLIPLFLTSKSQKVHGGGFEPIVLRWYSSHSLGRATPYLELAGGAVFTNSNLPPGNTSSLNFTARAGGGIHVFTRKRQSLDLGCGWMHASNANLGVRNPEFNGIRLSLAYHWFK
ncbi:MAG TPA: acyloxyacyl hydrolase [Terriglobales bacterium]|nr:acyloxyacyl hydrolase [Terriglobales bacterium]